MRKKPYATAEFFEAVMGKLKETGQVPEILDYALPTSDRYEIRTYEYVIINRLDFGGNEGIYLDLSLKAREDGKWEEHQLGTIKTLLESKEAMEQMGLLLARFMYEAHRFANSNLDDFTWEGYKVLPVKADGSTAEFSWDCATLERAMEKKDKELATGKYVKVIVTEYSTRKEMEYTKEG